ncbi:MAG: lysylphosphatidylglycerol synthase transmembrane domain-containing protein [Bacteroidota bacterium]
MKLNNTIKLLIKILVVAGAFAYIFYRLYHYDFGAFDAGNFTAGGLPGIFLLCVVMVLMFLNWLIESIKWKYLVSAFEVITVRKSLQAVMAGLTVSMITPNRIGELAGRVFVLKKEYRGMAVFSTMVGSISQLATTLSMGAAGIGILLCFYDIGPDRGSASFYLMISGLMLIAFLCLLFYFRVRIIEKTVSRLRWFKKMQPWLAIFSAYKSKGLAYVLFLSICRYLIFLAQFYLLLLFFNSGLNFFEAMLVISATYFVTTMIPSITFAEFGIRGSVVIFFCSYFTPDFAGAFSASVLLWFINVAIPALVGGVFVSRLKL